MSLCHCHCVFLRNCLCTFSRSCQYIGVDTATIACSPSCIDIYCHISTAYISKISFCRYNWSDPDYAEIAAGTGEGNDKFLVDAAHPLNESALECTYQSLKYNCTEIMTPLLTESGKLKLVAVTAVGVKQAVPVVVPVQVLVEAPVVCSGTITSTSFNSSGSNSTNSR